MTDDDIQRRLTWIEGNQPDQGQVSVVRKFGAARGDISGVWASSGVDVRRRACGVASADARWFVA